MKGKSTIEINFRKLRKDYAPKILKMGKELYEKKGVQSVKIFTLTSSCIHIGASISGKFDHLHDVDIEINITHSEILDANCDCISSYDCQHQIALFFYLEEHFEEIFLQFSRETDLETQNINKQEKKILKEVFEAVQTKSILQKDQQEKEQILSEYITSTRVLSESPFFLPHQEIEDKAEVNFLLQCEKSDQIQVYIGLRLPSRSKLFIVQNLPSFFHSIHYQESLSISGRHYFFNQYSFSEKSFYLLNLLIHRMKFEDQESEQQRYGKIDVEVLGEFLAKSHEYAQQKAQNKESLKDSEIDVNQIPLPYLYHYPSETPLFFSHQPVHFQFSLDSLENPVKKIFLKPSLYIEQQSVSVEDLILLDCSFPAVLYKNVYFQFPENIKRTHLGHFQELHNITIPESLLGTFLENSLPEIKRFARVENTQLLHSCTTLPFVEKIEGECFLQYLDGELEASLLFKYGTISISSSSKKITHKDIQSFVTSEGILARNLHEEKRIIHEIFQGFIFDEKTHTYVAKTEKKIIDFMTETVPKYQSTIHFHYPPLLLDWFVYEKTEFFLHFQESDEIGFYTLSLQIKGDLEGVQIDRLWECISSHRFFIEMEEKKSSVRNGQKKKKYQGKILILDECRTNEIVQLCDELGIKELCSRKEKHPLWTLLSFSEEFYSHLSLQINFSPMLQKIIKQILGKESIALPALPKNIQTTLRNYQQEGVNWINRFQNMCLNGILADDMGLGKTLQTIVVLSQYHEHNPKNREKTSLVVCPTSLTYNWKQELLKFCPTLKVQVVDGSPQARKKILSSIGEVHILITSYGLMQKDVKLYQKKHFNYLILDEAQYIKNRTTCNAKSVKMIHSSHKLILTGTPIENSLNDLWSLFDFLMPGFLGTYERFVEKYIRNIGMNHESNKNLLQKKVAPFILRRMKNDVLSELPPVSEIVYHCSLFKEQQELYTSYASSARRELSKLVKKEGFHRVQVHVLATLTRLKQICCHPALFAKEKTSCQGSAKYEMLFELLSTLITGKHKVVIFSQYTSMLHIIRKDLAKQGITFSYLDGETKNRLQMVNEFNENPDLFIFLVSLKAGGIGLNLTGADTIIHYDMWWNPAVERQARDRVHRMGQKKSVSEYKFITLNTIEEKIHQLQKRKESLFKEIIHTDEAIMNKLTWEEVLELLQI